MKNIFFVLTIGLTGCHFQSSSRAPAQVSEQEAVVFANPAFAPASQEVRETAQRVFGYRMTAERAYRNQDLPTETDKTIHRDTHGKTHACTKASFEVNAEVPSEYKSGIFAQPGAKFAGWIRFANGLGQIRHDLWGDARSFSIKLMGVRGDKVFASFPDEELFTQDFLFNNAPTFFVGNAREADEFFAADASGDVSGYFLRGLSPFAPTQMKKVAFNALYIAKVEPNLLTADYWSGSEFQLGNTQVRYITRPCKGKSFAAYAKLPELTPTEQTYVEKMEAYRQQYSPLVNGNHDFEEMTTGEYTGFLFSYPFALKLGSSYAKSYSPASQDYFRANLQADLGSGREGCFDFGVQPYIDEAKTPTKDPVAVWKSDPVWIAKINIPAQTEIATPERVKFCERMSFSVYHALKEHRPVGELNAVRGMIYKAMSSYRHRLNKGVYGEPRADYTGDLMQPFEAQQFYK